MNAIQKLTPYKKNILSALLVALSPWVVILVGCVAVRFAFEESFALGILTALLVFLLNGTRFRQINNMSHECLHGTFTKSRRWNERFGYCFAVWEGSSFKRVRREHATHHAHLGNFDLDQDFSHLKDYHFERPMSRAVIYEHLVRAATLSFLPKYVFWVSYDAEDPSWAKVFRFVYLVSLAGTLFFFPYYSFFLVILPYFTIYQVQKYLTDCLDHGGLLQSSCDPMDQTRNFIMKNRVLGAILFPRNDQYHLIHHLFPNLPVEQFRAAHQILMLQPNYAIKKHGASQQVQEWLR